MAGSWTTFSVPDTSTGTFNADIMLLLTDGSVLIHNGDVTTVSAANQWLRLTAASNGKYESGSWSSEIDMKYARQWFASGVLPDGRVFCIGGEHTDDPSAPDGDSATGEIFDPLTNSWSDIAKPTAFAFVSGDCNGAVLADGRVILGGANSIAFPQTKRTAIWDSVDGTWIESGLEFGALANTSKSDPFEEETWALLPDGSVLAPSVVNTPQAQRYLPLHDQWVNCANSPVNLAVTSISGVSVDETGGVIVLPSGKAFAIGGGGQTAIFTLGGTPTDPGSWVQGPSFPADTSAGANWPTLTALDAPACLLPNGKVVLMAGNAEPTDGDYFSSFPVLLEYDPASGATTLPLLDAQPALPAGNQTWQSVFLLLPTGQLLCSSQSNTLFLYTPDPATGSPDPSWKPANISVPTTLVLNHSYTVSGTQINGLSQAVTYGDDAGMATNYPIVQLSNPGTGQVVYLRSYDFSTMGIFTGTATPGDLQSCTIDLPGNLATGSWNLTVIANGIASDPVTVQIAAQDAFFILESSTFSVGEIDSFVKGMPPANAVFSPAFFVVVEGFTPAEIGINSADPIPPQLLNPPIVPTIQSPFPGHMQIAFTGPMIPEDPTLPPTPQRFTFAFSITFVDDSMFEASATSATLTATFPVPADPVKCSATLELTPNPNPYLLHGDLTLTPPEPWYLSQDLRVFQVAENGAEVFGASLQSTGTPQAIATTFIQDAVNNLRNNLGTARADFDAMPQDEDSEVLQLLPTAPNSNIAIYNFAVARVRLRDTSSAPNVRVFFRIWRAQQTNASYNSTTYARASNVEGQPIPVIGVEGDEIITIPFFATPRVDASEALHTQTDDFNRHDIAASAGETDFFFGCWLDINQPSDLRFPQRIQGVSTDGPFNTISPLFPIQQFMVAAHQCLVAEVAFDPDPIAASADPSNSDKLAQRNLAFVGAPNPGVAASRRVPQTFEVRPTLPSLPKGVPLDELMIEWTSVPSGSVAELYLPAVAADTVLDMANALYTSHQLEVADAHTLRFPAGGASYVPLLSGQGLTYAGLLTLDLPAGIRNGDIYSAVVRQITGVAASKGEAGNAAAGTFRSNRQWRRTTGTFKLTIPVSTKALLLAPEERYLAVMKWICQAIPASSRWYLVMQRYLGLIADRVSAMGGNPSTIVASPDGNLPLSLLPITERDFIGKVESMIFDRFGDFDGFTLETMDGTIHRFDCRDPRMAEVINRAWEKRLLIRIVTELTRMHRPKSVIFLL